MLVVSKLSQYHPSLKMSKVQQQKNGNFSLIGNTPHGVSENKMKAALDKKRKTFIAQGLPNGKQGKLWVKSVSTDINQERFKVKVCWTLIKLSMPRQNASLAKEVASLLLCF